MPILKQEADLFPADLFELPLQDYPWWVVHLRSRQEKLASREAHLRNIPFFLPLYERVIRGPGRRRTSYLPLFAGYFFFRGGLEIRAEMLKTNLCVRVLDVPDQRALESDLLQIRKLQLAGLPLLPHPELKIGDVIRILEGPFRGISGIILNRRKRSRLVVAVRFIHRAVSVELPEESVEPEPSVWQRRAQAG